MVPEGWRMAPEPDHVAIPAQSIRTVADVLHRTPAEKIVGVTIVETPMRPAASCSTKAAVRFSGSSTTCPAQGAKLEVVQPLDPADTFLPTIDGEPEAMRAEVVWRDGFMTGVRFIGRLE